MTMPVKELLILGEKRLANAGISNAKRESQDLYCYRFGLNQRQFLMEWQKNREFEDCESYLELLDRRADREPIQYITGSQNFYGYDIHVEPGVLIPRLDSETVVEHAIELIKDRHYKTVLDLCSGSGALGIAIAKECHGLKVTFSDESEDAVRIAKSNIEKLGLSKECKVVRGNLFEPFKKFFGNQKFDLIISNPPYIPTNVIPNLDREVKDFEPISALDGGEAGLDYYNKILDSAGDYLKKNGAIVLEIGYDQADDVSKILEDSGFKDIKVFKDLAGKDRTVIADI